MSRFPAFANNPRKDRGSERSVLRNVSNIVEPVIGESIFTVCLLGTLTVSSKRWALVEDETYQLSQFVESKTNNLTSYSDVVLIVSITL
jgi:hypothetical protein